jgi:HEAT repeat protein
VRRMASSLLPQLLMQVRMMADPRGFTGGMPALSAAQLKVVVGALSDTDATVRKNALVAFPGLRMSLPPDLLIPLLRDPDVEVRLQALNAALSAFDAADLAEHAGHLASDPERRIRLRLAQGLGDGRGRTLIKALQALLADKDVEISSEALMGLFRGDPSEWRQAVRDRLNTEGLPVAQGQRMIQYLLLLGKGSADELRAVLSHPRPSFRVTALETLSRGWPQVVTRDFLLPLLSDPSAEVRGVVLDLLKRTSGLTGIEIQSLLESPNTEVRRAVPELTRQLTDDAAAEIMVDLVLDDDLQCRLLALKEIGGRRLPGWQKLLQQSLRDPERSLVTTALQALTWTGSTEALPILNDFAQQTKDPELRSQAERQRRTLEFQLQAPPGMPLGPRRQAH